MSGHTQAATNAVKGSLVELNKHLRRRKTAIISKKNPSSFGVVQDAYGSPIVRRRNPATAVENSVGSGRRPNNGDLPKS